MTIDITLKTDYMLSKYEIVFLAYNYLIIPLKY